MAMQRVSCTAILVFPPHKGRVRERLLHKLAGDLGVVFIDGACDVETGGEISHIEAGMTIAEARVLGSDKATVRGVDVHRCHPCCLASENQMLSAIMDAKTIG